MAQMTGAEEALEVRIDRKVFPAASGEGDRVAIDGLAFSVPAGQFVCIVGPSGCGKTTMLNLVAGLDTDADAEVRFGNGAGVDSARIGYMFQTPRLLPWSTVRENVRIVMEPGTADSGRAEALLGEMELGDRLDEFPNRLSGGMQRRVALARAFVTEPSLLLLDEPFVSIDVPVATRLRSILLELWRARPTTVLFVTHDLREAIFLADRILFLSRGPSRLILDVPVPIARPRDSEDPELERFRQRLLAANKTLLHGLIGDDAGAGAQAAGGGPAQAVGREAAGEVA
jgi:NitT/TauT family transport system ATP-binding protein